MTTVLPPGFFGKLPCRGDFISRRLSRQVIDPWENWLRLVMHQLATCCGPDWLECYLEAPIWRFVLPQGVVGPHLLAGVMMPSVDAVGRYFPFTVLWPFAYSANYGIPSDHWFANLEELQLTGLEDGFDLDRFDDALLALAAGGLEPATRLGAPNGGATGRATIQFASPRDQAPSSASFGLQDCIGNGRTIWWTSGGNRIGAVALKDNHLPDPSVAAAMFDGEWALHGWSQESTDEHFNLGMV